MNFLGLVPTCNPPLKGGLFRFKPSTLDSRGLGDDGRRNRVRQR